MEEKKTEALVSISSSSSSSARKKNKPVRASDLAYYGTLKCAERTPNKSLFGVKKSSSNDLCVTALRKIQKFPTRPRSMKINLGEIAGYMITESEKDEIVKREREEMLKERREAEEEQRRERQQERLRREKKLKKPAESRMNVQPFHCRSKKRTRSSGIQIIENHQEIDDDSCRPTKKPKARFSPSDGPNPPPNIPPEVLQKIRSLNGHGETLVIQKGLYETDVDPTQNRFSIPLNNINKETFLTPEEVKLLETRVVYNPDRKKSTPRNMEVVFIDPGLREMKINFRMWEYNKGEKKSSSWSYVFVSKWKEVVKANSLKKGCVVQVWAFRAGGETLHFAMTVIERPPDDDEEVKEN